MLDITYEECRDRIMNQLLFGIDNDDEDLLEVFETLETKFNKKVVLVNNNHVFKDIENVSK